MDETLSISGNPRLEINLLFEREPDGITPTLNALLCQDILKYGTEHLYQNGFRFTELANWLMKRNNEFYTYYTGSKSHTPKNARVANKRQRIQRHIDILIQLGMIYEKSVVKAEKNSIDIPLYDFTFEGYLLAWLNKAQGTLIENKKTINEDNDNNQKKFVKIRITKGLDDRLSGALYSPGPKIESLRKSVNQKPPIEVQHLLDLVGLCSKTNDSCILLFIVNFFRKCNENGRFSFIIDHFMNAILPNSRISHGKDLIALFLGLSHSLNWILPAPNLFYQTLYELDEETKKLVLFQFKMEIEEYHNKNYFTDEVLIIKQINDRFSPPQILDDIDRKSNENTVVSISGKEWQTMRFDNIDKYSNVVLPGFCDKCKSKRSFVISIFRYLDSLVSAHGPYPSRSVSGSCFKCGQSSASTSVMRLPHFVAAWQ